MYEMTLFSYNLGTMSALREELSFHIGNQFFEGKAYSLVRQGSVDVKVQIAKKASSFEVTISLEGYVLSTCTRCNGELKLNVSSVNTFEVKLSDMTVDGSDAVLVNREVGILDLEPHIYDYIVLSIPERHVHPEGACDADMEEVISRYVVN